MTKTRKGLNRNNTKDFNRELYFISYIVCNTISLKGKKKCGETYFTKICTNYVEDWYDVIKLPYEPYVDIKPNPYGMVTYMPLSTFEGIEYAFIYELDDFFSNINLWKKEDIDGYRSNIKFIIDVDEIKKTLLSGKDGNGNSILSRTFTDYEIGQAETLSMIYQNFSPMELNILCSFKDVRKADMCIEYVFRCWSTDFEEATKLMKNNESEGKIIICLSHIARSCEQIETKVDLILDKMPNLIKRINEEVISLVDDDRNARQTLNTIYKRLAKDKMAPYFNDEFTSVLKEKYRMNREKIYPLTRALIQYYKENYEKDIEDYDLLTFKAKKEMTRNIKTINETFRKPAKIACDENEIEANLDRIIEDYNRLYEKEYNILRRRIGKGRRKERVGWRIHDGSLEPWN